MMTWVICHPAFRPEGLGYLQFGGWRPFHGFTVTARGLEYPNDPPQPLLAEARLRNEVVRLYKGSWVAIIQPDGSHEIARMD